MPIPERTPKVARTLAREEVYATLRDWIVKGDLKPSESLSDHQIADVLGVSRTPVREALRRLEDDGLVETAVNRWTRVAPINVESSIASYMIIEALDVLAFEIAGSKSDMGSLLSCLTVSNEAMILSAQANDAEGAANADEKFHGAWIEAAGSSDLSEIITKLRAKVRRVELAHFGAISRTADSYKEHVEIIQAIESGDPLLAVLKIKQNWQGSLERQKRSWSSRLKE